MSTNDNEFEEYSTPHTDPKPGPFLARVVSNFDPTYMGILEVEILKPVGGTSSESQLHQVKYMSPFYGVTSEKYTGKNDDYADTQKSYGMWMVPPDLGVTVVVIFIDGDPKRGYWMGCVPDENMNFMIPGNAATESVVEDVESDNNNVNGRVPTAEYNKKIEGNNTPGDPEKNFKPQHPFTTVLTNQGLLFDDIRGITTSSSRRESPSNVFGISTPGPLDKRPGAKKFKTGKAEWLADTYINRLGGSSFVMDDGDANWLRKKTASKGPPEYASIDAEETDGSATLPANELIRLRTRTGHQILMHNTEDLIYITNSRGTVWIELTSDGKIDIFAQDSISIKTDKDLNLYSGRDINIEAKRNFNVKVHEEMHTHVVKDHILIVDENQKIHVKMDVDKTYDQNYTHHVKQDVNKLYDQNYLQHVLGNVDKVFDGSLKTKIGAAEDRSVADAVTISSGDGYTITAGSSFQVKASGTNIDGGEIHLNSGNFGGTAAAVADEASEAILPQRLKLHTLSIETGEYDETKLPPTIMRRVVTTEPYVYHENLDPVKVKSAQTDRDIDGRYEDTDEEQTVAQSEFTDTMTTPPDAWTVYSLPQDTFLKGNN